MTPFRHDTHVYLVSAQPTPNLTPALDEAVRPRRVVLAASPDMAGRADDLERALRPRGVAVERWPLADAYDIEALRQGFEALALREAGADPALNATGGTKPMAIAAFQAFAGLGLPVFYVHPELDRLVWLSPAGRPARDLANRVDLGTFFLAHGAELAARPAAFGVPEGLQRLAGALVGEVARFQAALRALNWAAAKAEGSLVSPPLDRRHWQGGEFGALLGLFEAEDLLEAQGGALRFRDEAARFFANGGWLEQHVYAEVQALRKRRPAVQDAGRGLEVSRPAGGGAVRNELDVAFLADNRLHVVECKTRHFGAEPEEGGVGAEALYKLETLADALGGVQARALLASYQPLPEPARLRARSLGVAVCAGAELAGLPAVLDAWLGGRRA